MTFSSRGLVACAALWLTACGSANLFDPANPAYGPGGAVGNGEPITSGAFAGGEDTLPAPRAVPPPDDTRPPDCDGSCVAFCEGAGLQNPVNRGLCRSLWGVGLAHRPVDAGEACRRMAMDLLGRLPTEDEAQGLCAGGFGAAAQRMLATDEFVRVNQRRAADKFLYSTEVVNVEAIFDMDRLVEKLMRGLIPYDLFAAVVSAHPVLVRRAADPRDRAEALFRHFLGRPPFDNERSDMARLYALWHSGYYDHPVLQMRLPDAFVRFRCLDDDNQVDPQTRGECTSVLWGYQELILQPDIRAANDRQADALTMWAGLVKPDEWAQLQAPGRTLARDVAFWERAVDEVLVQYLGYELSTLVPEVRQELVRYLLANNGDIRAVHFAVVTSAAYLQSNGGDSGARYRWTYGPLKQVDAEVWLQSLADHSGVAITSCDHRISDPSTFLEAGSIGAYKLLQSSRWTMGGEEGGVDTRYSELARTLGGCPENVVGGRFKVVSILTTATQLSYVGELCAPGRATDAPRAAFDRLVPSGVDASRAVDAALAGDIASHQYRLLLGRPPSTEELTEAKAAGEQCAAARCNAEQFARPLCFALLTGAETFLY